MEELKIYLALYISDEYASGSTNKHNSEVCHRCYKVNVGGHHFLRCLYNLVDYPVAHPIKAYGR